MTDSTYTARLVQGEDDGEKAETVELEFIEGMPQKSFVRAMGEPGVEQVWELISGSDEFEYRRAGVPGADYS